jgi:hypothetical protein
MPKKNLSQLEHIEYYLGKDNIKNLFWKADSIPPQWLIPARLDSGYSHSEEVKNKEWKDYRTGVTYKMNNLGYRHDEDFDLESLKQKEIVLALGDSNTFGMCIERSECWPARLEEKLQGKYSVINAGIPGASNDSIARTGYCWIEALKENIHAVCCVWAPLSLREFVSKSFQAGVHTLENDNLPYEDWWNHIDWVGNNYNYWKDRCLLKSVCEANSIPFIDLMINVGDKKYQFDTIPFGNYNPTGPLTNQAMANWFYRNISGQPSLYQEITQP